MGFWEYLIVTVVGATIGATIGGIFAYLIAKKRFSQDNNQDGIRCVELLIKVLSSASTKCNDFKECLSTRSDYIASEDRAKHFIQIAEEKYAELTPAIDLFRRTWLRHQEQVWGLSQKNICKKESDRAKYEKISDELEKVYGTMEKLQVTVKYSFREYQVQTTPSSKNTTPNQASADFIKSNETLWNSVTDKLQSASDSYLDVKTAMDH